MTVLITIEIRFEGATIIRLQSQSKNTIVIDGQDFLFYPIGLGLPHETSTLSTSIRNLTLRASTPTLDGSSIGAMAAAHNGLLGSTVQSQVFDRVSLSAPTNPTAIYREQVIHASLNSTDIALTLSTESQPLKYWTS